MKIANKYETVLFIAVILLYLQSIAFIYNLSVLHKENQELYLRIEIVETLLKESKKDIQEPYLERVKALCLHRISTQAM